MVSSDPTLLIRCRTEPWSGSVSPGPDVLIITVFDHRTVSEGNVDFREKNTPRTPTKGTRTHFLLTDATKEEIQEAWRNLRQHKVRDLRVNCAATHHPTALVMMWVFRGYLRLLG